MIKFEVRSYKVYAVVSMVVDGEIKCESVTYDAPARDSRAAQKYIAGQYGVKAKDVNVLKIETVKNVYKFEENGDEILAALDSLGFAPVGME